MTRVIDAQTSIESMRDSGYKNEAYAIAELMDNSIQAAADIVELLTFSSKNDSGRYNIDKIAIFDNGHGMGPDLLQRSLSFGQGDNRTDPSGMGKFGFGLPSASISQCRHVDVWSWKTAESIYKTSIDVDDILNGEGENVPEPVQEQLPEFVRGAIGEIMPNSGTLVMWSKIDRAKWKTAITLSKHVEHEIGRMYRYFLSRKENPVTIRFKAYEKRGSLYSQSITPQLYKASDPLGLLKDSSIPALPGAYANESFFELGDERIIKVKDKEGNEHDVHLRWSFAKQAVLDEILKDERSRGSSRSAGDTGWGKYVKKNQGLSLVRAERELILRDKMLPREEKWRFIGMELQFPPALDEVFGVLNNKQDAVKLNLLNKDEDRENEGFETVLEYVKSLDANDPIHSLYEISDAIEDFKSDAQRRLNTIKVQASTPKPDLENGGPIIIPTPPDEEGSPDPDPIPEANDLVNAFIEQGIDEVTARVVARAVEDHQARFLVQEQKLETDAFFDVTFARGITLVLINQNHVFYEEVIAKCNNNQRIMLEYAIGSYGYMERMEQQNLISKKQYERTRKTWGLYMEEVLLNRSEIEPSDENN